MANKLKRLTQVLLVLFAILSLRLIQLQLVQGKRHSRLSDRNRIRKLVRPGPRGRIFDRNGRLLADTRPSFTVSVIPTEMNDSTLPVLAALLGIKKQELAERVRPVAYLSSPVKVKRNLDKTTLFIIEENRFRLSGVRTSVDPIRFYPSGKRYCHILGHLGEVNEQELKDDTLYQALDYIGRAGIEAQYEPLLRGRDGYEYIEIDVRGHEIGPLPEKRPVPAVPGKDLRLTIDSRLQKLAFRLTAQYERAAVVGLDIKTGAVLCFVSQPGFDPNIFISPISPETWDALASKQSKPFYNRVVSAGYPPGSLLKPMVALAGLRSGVVTAHTRFQPCEGKFRYGNRTFKCWTRHGGLDLLEAIAHSCNIYFYQLGLKLGLDSLVSFCRILPLGKPTGIDLASENAGIIPSRDWLDSLYGKGKWTKGVLLNFAIGQGEILATPLQLALTYAAIANNGEFCEPHLLASVDSAQKTVRTISTRKHFIPLNRAHLNQVKVALEKVVEYGTAKTARLKEITIAGKTGTAQTKGPDHAWFVGYAPAEKPEVVFAVLVENAGHGGVVAAPIARQLIRNYFSIPETGD